MTLGEFWHAEGEREGRDPGELMDEFYQDMEADDARVATEMKDPVRALENIKKFLISALDESLTPAERMQIEWDTKCDYGFGPDDIVECEVIDTSFSGGFKNSEGMIRAALKMKDGSERVVEYTESSFSGDFYEPPSGEENLVVVEVDGVRVVHKFDENCTFGSDLQVPMCEICEKFGGGALHGRKNPARYLLPAQYKSKIVKWVMGCVVHNPEWWFLDSGWLGPHIDLKQKEPNLPMVHDT